MDNELESLRLQLQTLKKEKDLLQKDYDTLKKTTLTNKINILHTSDFWDNIHAKVRTGDIGEIKLMVKNKKMTVHDINEKGETLLVIAARYGAYNLVQVCLNNDANVDHVDNEGYTALSLAERYGYHHVKQLLIFSKMNVNIGNKIKSTADTMHLQNGINHNTSNELSLIGQQTKELYQGITMELLINKIAKKLSFSDQMLSFCWNVASQHCQQQNINPLDSDLWKTISSVCSQIVQNGSKRDWAWLKTLIIPSTIWFKKISPPNNENEEKKSESDAAAADHDAYYLYFELLKLVDFAAISQLKELEKDLTKLAAENHSAWDRLTKWRCLDPELNEYESTQNTNTNMSMSCRQDMIKNGIVSNYTYHQLSESSGASFNAPKFYDYNQYLSELILLAQIVDTEFQESVQNIFAINRVTNEAMIAIGSDGSDGTDGTDGKIEYIQGPVKLIERAREKAINDYGNETYPTSACVVDINRCALIFDDITSLLVALELFVNKIKYYQSGNIIAIERDKNLFIEYIQKTGYADIKLNVLIKGKHHSIIGEVQFLLRTMKEYKNKAHDLYSIKREQDSIQNSVQKVLPMLLDEDLQLFIAGNRGNVNGLCDMMVINNKTIDEIMKSDNRKNNILHRICTFGHQKAFLFLKSLLTNDAFIELVLKANKSDTRPAEYCIRYGQVSIARILFGMEEIKKTYTKKNDLFRLLFHLFTVNNNKDLMDYMLTHLNITKYGLSEMMLYRYKQTAEKFKTSNKYHLFTLMSQIVKLGKISTLKKVHSLIGDKAFMDGVFARDGSAFNDNAISMALRFNKMVMLKYIMRISQPIKDLDELYLIISTLTDKKCEQSIALFLIKSLNLNQSKLHQIQSYKNIDVSKISKFIQQ